MMAAKRKNAMLPVYEIGKGNKLKKTGKKIAIDRFQPIERAGAAKKTAAEMAHDKAEAAELKRRYER